MAELKELGEIANFKRGLTYSKRDEVTQSDNIVLRANNISLATNELDFTELKYLNETFEIPESKLIREGTIMICTASGSKQHLGKVAYVDKDYGYAFGGFMGLLIPSSSVDGRYLYYSMLSKAYSDFIGSLSDGTNINNLKWSDLQLFRLPVPPLPEQHRIVAKLDAAIAALDEVQAHLERNRANAQELFESYLNGTHQGSSSHWTDTHVGNEVDILTGFPFKSDRYTEHESDIRLLRGDNITPGAFRWEGVKRWSASDLDGYDAFWLNEGDVVIAMDRTWIKSGLKYAIVTKGDTPSLLVQRVARLRCKSSLDRRYLGYLIATHDFTTYVLSVQTGTGVPHISGGQIAAFRFRRPPMKEQQQIADNLDMLSTRSKQLESTYAEKLSSLAELRQSLLGAAFRGEL